jgi:hypothetical protein
MIPDEEYPSLEAIWISNPTYESKRFKLEDYLLKFRKTELEQMELYLWAHLAFGNFANPKTEKEKRKTTDAKSIRSIINEMLGNDGIDDNTTEGEVVE